MQDLIDIAAEMDAIITRLEVLKLHFAAAHVQAGVDAVRSMADQDIELKSSPQGI